MNNPLSTTIGGAARRAAPLGGVGDRVENVRRIVVVRGGGIGDLLFALPALEALASAYPDSAITLLGTPAHVELLRGRPGPWSEVLPLPIAEGIRSAPGAPADPRALADFVGDMARRRFDLGVQLHGGGRFSNPFLRLLAPRVTAGPHTPDAEVLDRGLGYVYYQHEVLRALEVVGLAGAAPVALEPSIAVTRDDRAAGRALLSRFGPPARSTLLAVHPGATDPRRRWPTGWFGDVVARAVASGWRVAVVGDESDGRLARDLIGEAVGRGADCRRILDLTGQGDLQALVGVLDAADVFVGNDSGPRHLAQAVGTPTVSIFWAGNVITAAPLSRALHRIHVGWVTHCPICGVDATQPGWTAERCEHDPSYVAAVPVEPVWADVLDLASHAVGRGGPRPQGAADGDSDLDDVADLDGY